VVSEVCQTLKVLPFAIPTLVRKAFHYSSVLIIQMFHFSKEESSLAMQYSIPTDDYKGKSWAKYYVY